MSDPVNSDDLFALIRDDLKPYVETTNKGILSIARDPFEVLELLGESPGRFRVILSWQGEEAQGNHASSIVEHTLQVIVSHNRGLAILKGGNLSIARGADDSLMKLANDLRDRLRGVFILPASESISHELEYVGTEPVKIEGNALDAYQQTYKITTAITPPTVRNIPEEEP